MGISHFIATCDIKTSTLNPAKFSYQSPTRTPLKELFIHGTVHMQPKPCVKKNRLHRFYETKLLIL